MQDNVILSVRDLRVSFRAFAGKVQAVRGVSFDLHKGETIAIVGESGSGKSVTAKAIMGILAKNAIVESGQVIYDGRDILKVTENDMFEIRGKKIGLIFQDPLSALNPIMKIGKQVMETVMLNGNVTKEEAKAKAIELLAAVGIDHPEDRYDQYPFQFSGGMRQRIVIAIALARDPEILICDEPTTALDVTVQARILDLINDLKKKHGLSIIFITHDMGVVAEMADRIAVMYAGKVVEYGSSHEIFFEPAHPYTQALLTSMPDLETKGALPSIHGTPPNMLFPPKGDAFAARNPRAMKIDFEREPPLFPITETHWAATWHMHPNAPKAEMPEALSERIRRMKEVEGA